METLRSLISSVFIVVMRDPSGESSGGRRAARDTA
jgi:hypothetical protein